MYKIKLPQAFCMVGIGSNIDAASVKSYHLVTQALTILGKMLTITAVSPYYCTPAFPIGRDYDYINVVACVQSTQTPQVTLDYLHKIERMLKRVRVKRWGRRSIDLDLLCYNDCILPDLKTYCYWQKLPLKQQFSFTPDCLILPHPRIQDRAFVLLPLADISPQWMHPVLQLTVRQMLKALDVNQLRGIMRLKN